MKDKAIKLSEADKEYAESLLKRVKHFTDEEKRRAMVLLAERAEEKRVITFEECVARIVESVKKLTMAEKKLFVVGEIEAKEKR